MNKSRDNKEGLKKSKQKRKNLKKIFAIIVFFIVVLGGAFAIGVWSALKDDKKNNAKAMDGFFNTISNEAFFLIFMIIVISIISVYIHEFSHLLVGRILGYEFISMRFFYVEVKKEDGKLCVKKINKSEQSHECVMVREQKSSFFSVLLFNYAGVIANMIFAVVGLIVWKKTELVHPHLFGFMVFAINAMLILINIFPVKFARNDGYCFSQAIKESKNS